MLTSILQAITYLAWPLIVLVLGIMYRREIRALSARLIRGKVLGQEFELESLSKQVDELAESVPAPLAVANHPPDGAPPASTAGDVSPVESGERHSSLEETIDGILGLLPAAPETAIVQMEAALTRGASRVAQALSPTAEVSGILFFEAAVKHFEQFDKQRGNLYQKANEGKSNSPSNNAQLGAALAKILVGYRAVGEQLFTVNLSDSRGKAVVAQYIDGGMRLLWLLDALEHLALRQRRRMAATPKPPATQGDAKTAGE